MKKREGSVLDILSVMIMILSLSILMLGYLNTTAVMQRKEEAGMISRKYILRMETVGCLTASDSAELVRELTAMGITDIDLSGTTFTDAGYGNPIVLHINGRIKGKELEGGGLTDAVFKNKEYPFTEKRMSTAKN